ncbi:hypothetical protein ABK040_000361 [Willaertia magna]
MLNKSSTSSSSDNYYKGLKEQFIIEHLSQTGISESKVEFSKKNYSCINIPQEWLEKNDTKQLVINNNKSINENSKEEVIKHFGITNHKKFKRFIVMSDTHNKIENIREIPNGDVLLHCGDFTQEGTLKEIEDFNKSLGKLKEKFKLIIVIAGNHDYFMDPKFNQSLDGNKIQKERKHPLLSNCDVYLQDNSYIIENAIKIHGTPWTFSKMAFGCVDKSILKSTWGSIEKDVDILMSHTPPFNILDLAFDRRQKDNSVCNICGSKHMSKAHWGNSIFRQEIVYNIKPKVCCFGHVHDTPGIRVKTLESLLKEDEYIQQQVVKNLTFVNQIGEKEKNQSITFINAAADLTMRVYFFDFWYEPNSRDITNNAGDNNTDKEQNQQDACKDDKNLKNSNGKGCRTQ